MRRWKMINRFPTVTLAVLAAVALAGGVFWLRSPGPDVRDGRHDRGQNGLVLGTAWMASDAWFESAGRADDKPRYRDAVKIGELARALREHHITELFLRVPPPDADGALHGLDAARTEALLYECYDARGWAQISAERLPLDEVRWRRFFVLDLRRLLDRHPRLRGVQFDATTIAAGDANLPVLLDELRAALTSDPRVLSIVVGEWPEPYFREIARRTDQIIVPMAVPASFAARLSISHRAEHLTRALAWSEGKPVLVCIPADSRLRRSLSAAHIGLSRHPLPDHYQGLVLDAGDAPSPEAWRDLRESFLRR